MPAVELVASHHGLRTEFELIQKKRNWFEHLDTPTISNFLLRLAMLEAEPARAAEHPQTACLAQFDVKNTGVEVSLIAQEVLCARRGDSKDSAATPEALDWLEGRVKEIYALAGRAIGDDDDKLGNLFDDVYLQIQDVDGVDALAYMEGLAVGDEPWAKATRWCVNEYKADAAEEAAEAKAAAAEQATGEVPSAKRPAEDDDAPPAKRSRPLE